MGVFLPILILAALLFAVVFTVSRMMSLKNRNNDDSGSDSTYGE
jgi:hypothetical protein